MFGTSGIRGAVGHAVTGELALSVGRALASSGYERVVVGRDVRDSGGMLVDALVAGLLECGSDAVDVGVAATPTVARAIDWMDADAGAVVTASHNPPPDNGIKLWTPSGQAFDEDRRTTITECIEQEAYELAAWDGVGTRISRAGVAERHVEAITAGADALDDLSVVVDVGNGTGGVTAEALLDLGCAVQTLNAQPDGRFPGRPSEPTEETLTTLARVVEATGADLGVAHDGDADRTMAVDETGAFVPKDALLALFAREAASAGDRVAAPVDTSLAVDDALAAVGATVTRTPVGDVYVAERAAEADVVFGGEPSGAWIWPDETRCPDGPLAAVELAQLVAREGSLHDLVGTVEQYPIQRTSIEVADNRAVMERVTAAVQGQNEDVDTLDGVRVGRDDGWFLLRASGTQPLVRVTAEARDPSRAEALFAEAVDLVESAR